MKYRIISGGQTGVDRGALLAAVEFNVDHGGWFPKGSLCEDSVNLKEKFPHMVEHPSGKYPDRTLQNVKDSDVTILVYPSEKSLGKGTILTRNYCLQTNTPFFEVDIERFHQNSNYTLQSLTRDIVIFLQNLLLNKYDFTHEGFFTINVAGPRGSSWSEGGRVTKKLVINLLKYLHSDEKITLNVGNVKTPIATLRTFSTEEILETNVFDTLTKKAVDISQNSHSPYSEYSVGASAVTNYGRIVSGTNVENFSYGLTLCAECSMISDLLKNRVNDEEHVIGFVCVDSNGKYILPCGRCRQLLAEFGKPETLIKNIDSSLMTLEELLPGMIGQVIPKTLLS